MFDLIPANVKNFIDSIFAPPLTFLNMASEYLGHVGLIAGKGINLNHYLSFFSYLPGPLQAVVNSLLASILLLAILQLVKSIVKQFFTVKSAVKWW